MRLLDNEMSRGTGMSIVKLVLRPLLFAALLPLPAAAQDKMYVGLAMFNSHYHESGDHRSTGLMARAGYTLTSRFSVEGHMGGSIGTESSADFGEFQAQISQLYGLYGRLGTPSRFGTLYLLGGYTYGQRELTAADGTVSTGNVSSPSLGAGIQFADEGALGFTFEVIRYFHASDFSVDAWNLGLVTRF